MKFRPLENRVLVRRDGAEKVSEGGIDTTEENCILLSEGEIFAVVE